MKTNIGGWFEIPATNIERAKAFYEKVFELELNLMDMGGVKMAWFPNAGEAYGAMGCVIQHESYTPSHQGTLIYLSTKDDMKGELERIPEAGGKVLQQKTQISPEYGYMGLFEDTEGNRVALHSQK